MNNLTLEIQNNIAIITLNNIDEKVNKLSLNVINEFDIMINSIKDDIFIKALLIQSGKENCFIAGADINEIELLKNEYEIYKMLLNVHKIFDTLENLKFPSIAYINGSCMGGGLEFALACTYRIASTNSKTKFSFPEIKLGIFPGFAGTVRAPKVVGLINALDLILSAKTIDFKKAYKIGLVDKVINNEQKEFELEKNINELIGFKKKKNKRKKFIELCAFNKIVFKKALKSLEQKVNKNFQAPYIALDVIKKTYNMPHKQAILIEAKNFSKLAITKESKNLIKLFFSIQKINKNFTKTLNPISNATVIGNGVMGTGIAWLFSKYLKEVRVKMLFINEAEDFFKSIFNIYNGYVKKHKMTKNEVEFKMNKISYTNKTDGFNSIQLAIEAIFENEKEKKKLYLELEDNMPKDSIIATNTSSISIEKLCENMLFKERFLGVHFFNPVNMMPLVEVISTKYTSNENINKVFELLISCGKSPILVNDCAGFLVNRILLPYLNEAVFILEQNQNIVHIDKVIKDFGMPMGPYTLVDTVGIDIGYHVSLILKESYGQRMPISPILQNMFDNKILGKKMKKGFYNYKNKNKEINEEVLKFIKINNKKITDKQIIQRTMFTMINEASRCLEEHIVNDADIIDFAMIMGTGFPPYKGGLLAYANEIGIKNIVNCLLEFEKEFGERFHPSSLLTQLSKEGLDFNTGELLWKH